MVEVLVCPGLKWGANFWGCDFVFPRDKRKEEYLLTEDYTKVV